MFNQLNLKVTHADGGFILTVTNPDDPYGPPLATYALTDTHLQGKLEEMILAYESLPDPDEEEQAVGEVEASYV